MKLFTRAAVMMTLLALPLGGCVNFDPQDWFAGDWFNKKKPLPGERRELFPGGVPGVTRGVPTELVKGNQAAALQEQEAEEQRQIVPEEPKAAPKPKPRAKPKPKPKVVENAGEPEQRPTAVTVRPRAQPPTQQSQQTQWPDPPATRRPQQQQFEWPDPPAPR
jgi:outer membrane biosynthesis protein TonB